jgi:hypothetical protein
LNGKHEIKLISRPTSDQRFEWKNNDLADFAGPIRPASELLPSQQPQLTLVVASATVATATVANATVPDQLTHVVATATVACATDQLRPLAWRPRAPLATLI